MARKRWKKTRRGVEVTQTTPSFKTLGERFNAGLRSQKEITRRVKDVDPKALSKEERDSWFALRAIALSNKWLAKDEVPVPAPKTKE